MRKGDVEIGVGLNVERGDLDRHSRVLGTRKGEDVHIACNCLFGSTQQHMPSGPPANMLHAGASAVASLSTTPFSNMPHLPIDDNVEHALPRCSGLPTNRV